MPLFESSPSDIQDLIRKEKEQKYLSAAMIPRGRGRVAAMAKAGGMLGDAIAGATGYQDPRMVDAKEMELIKQESMTWGLDPNSPEYFTRLSDRFAQAGKLDLSIKARQYAEKLAPEKKTQFDWKLELAEKIESGKATEVEKRLYDRMFGKENNQYSDIMPIPGRPGYFGQKDSKGKWNVVIEPSKDKESPDKIKGRDGKWYSRDDLYREWKQEQKIPDEFTLMMMAQTNPKAAEKLREKAAKATPFSEWVNKKIGAKVYPDPVEQPQAERELVATEKETGVKVYEKPDGSLEYEDGTPHVKGEIYSKPMSGMIKR